MSIINKNDDYPDLLSETLHTKNTDRLNTDRLNREFDRVLLTPERLNFEKSILETSGMPFHSAPATPRQQLNGAVALPPHSVSAPGTPEHRLQNDPPRIQRLSSQPPGLNPNKSNRQRTESAFTSTSPGKPTLLAPSAFQAPKTVGVIGSGIPPKQDILSPPHNISEQHSSFPRGFADPRLAPGNGAMRSMRPLNNPGSSADPNLAPGHPLRPHMQSSPMPPQQYHQQSQQQQLLQSQRMAQIQQAQLLQQQKLQQIANQANQQKLMQQKQQQSIGSQGKQFPAAVGMLNFLRFVWIP